MKEVLIPDPIRAALEQGAALCVSISGGKDSQALLSVCCRLHRAHRWKGELVALHADLGRAEWPETSPQVRLIANRYRVPLHIVRWEKGDLLDRMENRRLKKEGDGEPFWPSPQSRYCTSDLKSDPLDKWLRRYPHLVSAHGIRAQESAQRAKKPWFCKHKEIAGERWLKDDTGAGRQAWVWNAIFHWRLEEVWEEIAVSPTDLDRRRELYRAGEVRRALYNWPAHPAYVYGNERLSCVFCLAGETEVVTRAGLRPIRELAGSRHLLLVPKVTPYGIHSHGSFVETEVRSFGVQPLLKITMHRTRQQQVIYATPEHRWLVFAPVPRKHAGQRGRPRADQVTVEQSTVALQPGAKVRALRAHPPIKTEPVPFAVVQGFVYGDGTKAYAERPATLSVYSQEKREALLPYFVGHRTRERGHRLDIYGLPRLWKEPPNLTESRAFLLSWLAGYFAADGCVSRAGQATISSARTESVELVRNIAAIVGVRYGPASKVMRVGMGKEASAIYKVTLDARDIPPWFLLLRHHQENAQKYAARRTEEERLWVVDQVEETDRIEEVYCAVVPGVRAFGLAHDVMTGNCIYGSQNDLLNGARHNPELYRWYVERERLSGFTFQHGKALGELFSQQDLLQEGGVEGDTEGTGESGGPF